MRPTHIKRALLVFALQVVVAAATVCFDRGGPEWMSFAGAAASFVIPYFGYIVALYDAPMFTDRSRVLKTAAATVVSIYATTAGAVIILLVFGVSGFPL
jgi:hypothetical protein